MATYVGVNIGSGGGIRQQPITWNNVDLSPKVFCGIHMKAIPQEVLQDINL